MNKIKMKNFKFILPTKVYGTELHKIRKMCGGYVKKIPKEEM